MRRSAILSAKQVILARLSRVEPKGGVAARQDVLLNSESRHVKAMNHVLRGHDQLDVLAGGNMELVDLALTLHVLDLPHPLLCHDVNFSSARGRSPFFEEQNRAPYEESQHHAKRNDRPSDFEDHRAFDLMGLVAGPNAIFDREDG